MKFRARHPLRVTGRLLWLGGELVLATIGYAAHVAFQPYDSLMLARAEWLQQFSRRLLKIFQVETQCNGRVPTKGLLVCNHLSYLDVLVIAALAPSLFVAKCEVRKWPLFGWFAGRAGTIFVNRNKRLQAAQSAHEIGAALRTGALVVLFAEGTSSGGKTVLPFKSSLLEPATSDAHTLIAGLIAYQVSEANGNDDVCYWKDMTLVPHLINLLSKREIQATVSFTEMKAGSKNRKQLARQLHTEVLRLKEALAA